MDKKWNLWKITGVGMVIAFLSLWGTAVIRSDSYILPINFSFFPTFIGFFISISVILFIVVFAALAIENDKPKPCEIKHLLYR